MCTHTHHWQAWTIWYKLAGLMAAAGRHDVQVGLLVQESALLNVNDHVLCQSSSLLSH